MLDKPSDQDQTGQCSDCGCTFPLLPPDSGQTSTSSSPPQQDGQSRCPSCQESGSLPNGRRPHRRIRLEPHSCSVCNKTFISSAHLTLHLTSHNKERKFRCSICGKLFHQASHLMAHKITHSGDRPFKCPDCGKTFGRASHLKTHRRLHTGEKPFKCTFCDKSFTQKAGLLAHVRVHTGEQPYKCEQCGEGFRYMSLLLSHKAQESAGIIPTTAAAAAAAAAAPAQPDKTQTSAEDLKCGICCRSFVRSSYIRLRVRLKKGQRPYHCKVCNKTFVKLDTFVNHCDKHLRLKKEKNKETKVKVVKPPLFVPLSRPASAPIPPSSTPPTSPPPPPPPPPTTAPESAASEALPSDVNTRSKSKAKSKTEQ